MSLIKKVTTSFNPANQYDLFIGPGETLTVSATSTNTSTIGVTLNWSEDI